MKKTFSILMLILLCGSLWHTPAQTNQQLKLRVNNRKTAANGKLTIKFVSLIEDSRCPQGVNCIQAGNAKVQINVAKRGAAGKTFELNTDLEPNSILFEGYEIKLAAVEPTPKENIRINRNQYVVTLIVNKSQNSK